MSAETKEIVVVIGPGSIGQAIARRVGSGRTLLLAAHNEEATEAAARRLRGDGFDVAGWATDISERDAVEALAKRGNALRVETAAAAWGRRGARVNTISPGVIITPLALDELSGPRKDWFENVRRVSAAKRFATPDEVGDVAAFLLGEQAGFITGADLLMDGGVTSALRTGELTM
jgi:NAD(P)-dependent dehydrogenase (short-subunit alcohol dehydrogenase family)